MKTVYSVLQNFSFRSARYAHEFSGNYQENCFIITAAHYIMTNLFVLPTVFSLLPYKCKKKKKKNQVSSQLFMCTLLYAQ